MRLLLLLIGTMAAAGCGGMAAAGESMVTGKWIEAEVAKSEKLSAENLEATLLPHAEVPGVTPFRCRVKSKSGRRGGFIVGVVHDGKLELDNDRAIELVIAAWHYGEKRTATPVQVARVIGFLEGEMEPAYPVLTAEDIEALVDPRWKPLVFLPREAVIDGAPAVEYWNRDGRPPLWLAQLVVKPGGKVELSRKSIGSFLK
jgi:hypothetical protein